MFATGKQAASANSATFPIRLNLGEDMKFFQTLLEFGSELSPARTTIPFIS
jgi:hypothetical protein